MSLDFTIAIPTYNGASRLPKVLDKLLAQVNTEQITWEVIVVDNNSTDETAQVVRDYQTHWLASVPLRYCFEPQQGAAYARLTAVREAKGELVGFLDDDNLPAPDWIQQAYLFAKEYPQAGAFSGQIHGEFEVPPPEGFERIQAFLAIREHGMEAHRFKPENLQLPPAASLVIRKQAWCESVPPRPKLTGKLPGLMIQGDDYEPLLYIHKAGWEIWYHPQLHSYHQIPKSRLERDYLLSLCRGCGLATCELRMINAKDWEKPILIVRTLAGNLRRVIWQAIRYRLGMRMDLIAACELEFFWGSSISPFYSISKMNYNKSLPEN